MNALQELVDKRVQRLSTSCSNVEALDELRTTLASVFALHHTETNRLKTEHALLIEATRMDILDREAYQAARANERRVAAAAAASSSSASRPRLHSTMVRQGLAQLCPHRITSPQ